MHKSFHQESATVVMPFRNPKGTSNSWSCIKVIHSWTLLSEVCEKGFDPASRSFHLLLYGLKVGANTDEILIYRIYGHFVENDTCGIFRWGFDALKWKDGWYIPFSHVRVVIFSASWEEVVWDKIRRNSTSASCTVGRLSLSVDTKLSK